MHFPGEGLSPVDGQDVAEVSRDGPPHSGTKTLVSRITKNI